VRSAEEPHVRRRQSRRVDAGAIRVAEDFRHDHHPRLAGYRIADTVLVTADGPDSLTHYPRKLDEIVIG